MFTMMNSGRLNVGARRRGRGARGLAALAYAKETPGSCRRCGRGDDSHRGIQMLPAYADDKPMTAAARTVYP
jgi:hypothetical protein